MKHLVLLLAPAFLFLTGCKKDSDDSSAAGPCEGKAAYWTDFEDDRGDDLPYTLTSDGDGLVFEVEFDGSASDNRQVEFGQMSLTGDFTIELDYEGLLPVEASVDYKELALYASNSSNEEGIMYFQLDGGSWDAVEASVEGGTTDFRTSDPDDAGTITITRSGTSLTVTSNGLTASNSTFGTDDIDVEIVMGIGNDGTSGVTESIKLTGFRVTGGGGSVSGDDFRCIETTIPMP